MAYSQQQLDELQGYYARGITDAWLADGSKMSFRSLDEMERIISRLEGDLGINPTHDNVAYPKYKRGF